MSEVRMCDNCAEIFSVNATGWDSYTRNRSQIMPGNPNPVTIGTTTLHICRKCNIGQTGALSPRIAITASEDDTKEDDNAV